MFSHYGINATLSFSCPLHVVTNLITNASISVITPARDIT